MARLRGGISRDGGGFSLNDFYSTSGTSIPTYRPVRQATGGMSKYATPEEEALQRPFADIGKLNVDLLGAGGGGTSGYTMPNAMPYTNPAYAMPNAEQQIRHMDLPWAAKGSGIDFPGINYAGQALDFLANMTAAAPTKSTRGAIAFYEKLRDTPDSALTPIERGLKSSHAELMMAPPDSPLMQGKQISEIYELAQIAAAHEEGGSAYITRQQGTSMEPGFGEISPGGMALTAYGYLSNMLKRAEGSVPEGFFGTGLLSDQFKEITKPDATLDEIGEERWAIREKFQNGEVNEEEARDLIALSSFALSNPNPLGTDTPLHVVGNAVLAVLGEAISDPLTFVPVVGQAAKAARTSVVFTSRTIERTVANEIADGVIAAAARGGRTMGAAEIDAARNAALQQVTSAVQDAARSNMGRTAALRRLPKAATAQAKAYGKVATEQVTDHDYLNALLDMGADASHAWAPAIKRGVQAAGVRGDIATKVPAVIQLGEAIDKMVDPLSLFGYWKTGRAVPMIMSRQAAHGYIDAIGWRVIRNLDNRYSRAGVDPARVQTARGIAAANHTVQAADRANTARSVAMNSALGVGQNATEAALQHAERRGNGDIRKLVKDQVGRTLEFIVPRTKGGMADALEDWRARAARQLADFGATIQDAQAVASTMLEREMRGLANDHWGLMIDVLETAKRNARPVGRWSREVIDRIVFMGPRQMAQQDAKALRKAVVLARNGDVAALQQLRDAVHQFRDLSEHISEALDDAELIDAVDRTLTQIDKALPVRIDDLTDIPPELEAFVRDHPDYHLMLAPKADDHMIPVRNGDDVITGMHTWLNNVTGETPVIKVTELKAVREGLFRGISGGEIERNASRRFAVFMADRAGLSEEESAAIMRSIRQVADLAETGPRGLTADAIYKAVQLAKISAKSKKKVGARMVTDAVLEAYENEMALVGVLPKMTGWAKKKVGPIGGNALGWLTDYLYGTVRFRKSPLFFLQEVPEAPFFLALMGRYPAAQLVPQWMADAAGPLGRGIRGAKENIALWNDKTLMVMDRMIRASPNAGYDFFEAAELARMGFSLGAEMMDPRGNLAKIAKKLGHTSLDARKRMSLAIAARKEFGEQWRRSLMQNAPEQWRAVRAYYPDDMSDGEVAVQWLLDMMARSDPDGVYSVLSPHMFQPSHIGKRAEVSDKLVRYFVYGVDDYESHTWESMTHDVRSGAVQVDHVRNTLTAAGADPDYVERTITKLTFGTEDEFYSAAVSLGAISQEGADAWRAGNRVAAALQDITPEEYLARNYMGRPLSTDQLGNVIGDTLFDDIAHVMRTRGRELPTERSQSVRGLKHHSQQMVDGVVPIKPPPRLARGTPINAQQAAAKVRRWESTRTAREADPTLGRQPVSEGLVAENIRGEPVEGYTLQIIDDPWTGGGPTSGQRYSDIGMPDQMRVEVRDADGNIAATVDGVIDPADGTWHTHMINTRYGHHGKGIGAWMYRQLEEQIGVQIEPSSTQLPEGRDFWSSGTRPFGPTEQTHRQIHDAYERGIMVPVGPVEQRDPIALIPYERKTDDLRYLDPTDAPEGVIREPIAITADGRVLDGDDRTLLGRAMDMREVPVQVYDYRTKVLGRERGSIAMGVSRMRPEIGEEALPLERGGVASTLNDIDALRAHPTIATAHRVLPEELRSQGVRVLGTTEVIGRFEGGAEPSQIIHLDPREFTPEGAFGEVEIAYPRAPLLLTDEGDGWTGIDALRAATNAELVPASTLLGYAAYDVVPDEAFYALVREVRTYGVDRPIVLHQPDPDGPITMTLEDARKVHAAMMAGEHNIPTTIKGDQFTVGWQRPTGVLKPKAKVTGPSMEGLPPLSGLDEINKAGHHAVIANDQDAVITTIRGASTMARLGLKPNGYHLRITGIDPSRMPAAYAAVGDLIPMGTIDRAGGTIDFSTYASMLDDDTLVAFNTLAQDLRATFSAEDAHIRWYWRDEATQTAAREEWFSGPEDSSFNAVWEEPAAGGAGVPLTGAEEGSLGLGTEDVGGGPPTLAEPPKRWGGGYGRGLPTPRLTGGVKPLYQTELHTIGPVTPAQYQRQIETLMDPIAMGSRGLRAMTEKELLHAAEWYSHMRRATFALVDPNLHGNDRILAAARILVAFGTTQVNTSPADGWRHVFRAMGMAQRGETLQIGEARHIVQQMVGLNPEQLDAIIWGEAEKISQYGIGQKLLDFLDSLTGKKTRSTGVTGPRGDWGPVAVDVHTKRDFGYLDKKMGSWVYRLVERKDARGNLVMGTKSQYVEGTGFVVEMSDGTTEVIPMEYITDSIPTDEEYDLAVELANDVRDHFNQTQFLGRSWSSEEVQALGWARMQLLKSSDGARRGEVGSAIFEQSRWMGSNDLMPSSRAPMNEVHPWDVLSPEHHRAAHIAAAYHASDEAERLSGVRVLTRRDADAVVNGEFRPAQTVEIMTDSMGAEQYLAHYLYFSEQDSGVLLRDYTGTGTTPHYDQGVGISVDVPVPSMDHARDALERLAGDPKGVLRQVGAHSFIAQTDDGKFVVRTLWEPKGKTDRNAFNAAMKKAKIDEVMAREGFEVYDTLVDFVALRNNWAKSPKGKGYLDVIQRGSGEHGVMRSAAQRTRAIKKAQRALDAATASGDEDAIDVAQRELNSVRAAPGGRTEAEVQELVRTARLRVRETVRSEFERRAPREVRHERERVLGEVRDANADELGTDPTVGDVLDRARGSNGEPLYERAPNGTVRAAITRSASDADRSQLFFNKPHVTERSILHELIHKEAWNFDDSMNRTIAGIFNGLEGTPYGTWTPGTPLTEAQHEWLVNQAFLWMESGDAVHPVLAPLMEHLAGKLGAVRTMRSEAYKPARDAIKQIDNEIAALVMSKVGKTPAEIAVIDSQITLKNTAKASIKSELRALKRNGGLHPDVKAVLDKMGERAGERSRVRASTFNADEQDMLEYAQISMSAASRRANDLVHMRGERSALERSLNHPFLGPYPTSYMYGKVLPHLAEFLMFRPFGQKAPFAALAVGNHMHQSFERQQQYDEDLRNFLYKNEPFLRAMSIFVPGLPWDLPTAMPFWARRMMENWLTNNVREMRGQKPEKLDVPSMVLDSALYQLTLRGPDSWGPIWDAAKPFDDSIDPATGQKHNWKLAVPKGVEAIGAAMTGEAPAPTP